MSGYYRLVHAQARQLAQQSIANAPDGFICQIKEPARNLEQNALLWALLGDVAKQVVWHGRKLEPESWKHIFTASLKKLDVVPNLEGTGFVALGLSTSRMSKREFSELIELIRAFGVEHAVVFDDCMPAHMG